MVSLSTPGQPRLPPQQQAFPQQPQPLLQPRPQQPPQTMGPVRMAGSTLGMDATNLSQTSKNIVSARQ